MRLQSWPRWGLLAATAIGFVAISACGTKEPEPAAIQPKTTGSEPEASPSPSKLKNEIPSIALAPVLAAHYKGLGHMERVRVP